MPTTTVSKTANQTLLEWADTATANVTVGSALDVSTKLAAFVVAHIGRRSGTAFTANFPNLRIEGSVKSSGNDAWAPLAQFQPPVGASIANTTLNGAVSAGATTATMTSATGMTAGDLLFLKGDTDAGNEVARVKSVSSNTITFEEALTNDHASGNAVTDQAEVYVAALDLTGVVRIRAVFENAGSGQTAACRVLVSTGDSLSTV